MHFFSQIGDARISRDMLSVGAPPIGAGIISFEVCRWYVSRRLLIIILQLFKKPASLQS
jgi:hypothetical protein